MQSCKVSAWSDGFLTKKRFTKYSTNKLQFGFIIILLKTTLMITFYPKIVHTEYANQVCQIWANSGPEGTS